MAFLRRRPPVLSFRNNRVLQQHVLSNVTPTGKTLGNGSYGTVLEVKYGNLKCAAKKMHESLLQTDNEGVESLVEKYERECQIMASLRHPNITLFLGICFLPDSQLPLLVMEQLDMSLDDLLEHVSNLPLTLKVSFLEDVSKGLDYLHQRDPPIIHRDLTARNVLLTSSLSAKITDMGNSRIVSMMPGQLARTLSQLPGTLVYMPPEALSDDHRYGPALDIFSFGHLALYTLIQEFPGNLLPHTYSDPNNPDRLHARSEIERRVVYMEKLETHVARSQQALTDLVKQCLHNTPGRRLSSEDLLARMCAVREEVEGVHGSSAAKLIDAGRVLIAKEIKVAKERLEIDKMELRTQLQDKVTEIEHIQQLAERQQQQIEQLEDEMQQQRGQLQQQRDQQQIEHLEDKMQQQRGQLQQQRDQLQQQGDQLQEQRDQLQHMEVELQQQRDQVQQLEEQLQQQNVLLQQKDAELERKDEEPQKYLHSDQGVQRVDFPLNIKWTRGPDMPFKMNTYIQSVTVQEVVYVGGGVGGFDNSYIVMAYNTRSETWHQLPPHAAWGFAMVVINNKLVLVGGRNRSIDDTNTLGVWEAGSRQWTHPYGPMPTPRSWLSAVVYKQWLIVAGGMTGSNKASTIEVLDISSNQWYTAPPTPIPWSEMRSAIIGDMCYFMGGYGYYGLGRHPTEMVYSVSLPTLVPQTISTSCTPHPTWKTISTLGHTLSAPLSIGGELLAVGGKKNSKTVSDIRHYVPETNKWVVVGHTTSPLSRCSCTVISMRLVAVVGGVPDNHTFYLGSLV